MLTLASREFICLYLICSDPRESIGYKHVPAEAFAT